MSAIGYIQVSAYTGNARIPLKDVALAITESDGSVIALRLTNRSGQLDVPVEIEVPDLSASQSPGTGVVPFRSVDLYARTENYEEIEVKNLQVFASTVTMQNLQMIPLSELPEYWNQTEIFQTDKQNL